MKRLARSMGVHFGDLPIFTSFDVAPIGSPRFMESLERDLDEIKPPVFLLDPLYSFHGAKADSANLHQEGALLNALLRPCAERGVTLLVANHYNKTGTGTGLQRITMAGGAEWCDSWILLDHREAPDVASGDFRLKLDIGSRQWGGSTWDLDLHIGRFDEDMGEHDGDVTWGITRATSAATAPADDKDADTRHAIVNVLTDRPGTTKTDVFTLVKGNRERFQRAFDRLADTGMITHDQTGKTTAKGGRPSLRWRLSEVSYQTPARTAGTHTPEVSYQTPGTERCADEAF
ncbi:MAG: AAA family ATPase [Acidimicrobiales bacterium]|nr:AAA family ATPase [Acidimicrobiales bacterium]